eukprot:1908900-Prymnesium_polylepis.1
MVGSRAGRESSAACDRAVLRRGGLVCSCAVWASVCVCHAYYILMTRAVTWPSRRGVRSSGRRTTPPTSNHDWLIIHEKSRGKTVGTSEWLCSSNRSTGCGKSMPMRGMKGRHGTESGSTTEERRYLPSAIETRTQRAGRGADCSQTACWVRSWAAYASESFVKRLHSYS